MKIKICGLRRLEDIEMCNKYHPDYVGFVFAKSKRQVTKEQAALLKQHLDCSILSVGVFVNTPISLIKDIVERHIIDLVQLHGDEDQDYIKELKKEIDVPIIKAITIINEDSFNQVYDVDYYLLDNKIAGSGQSFDWKLIRQLDQPFFLAGGINLDNLEQAMKIDCFALDVSSGVETNGYKDDLKIKEIVRRVKND